MADPMRRNTKDAMESENVLTKQQRIAENARTHPEVAFTSLAYHMDLEWLYEAYRRTRKDGAVGVDEQTAEQYEENLEQNLESLLERAKAGSYRAPAVRRVQIPKGKGTETRPIGIPTFEDKVLQRAVQMLLEPLYEQDFVDCSHGFRPERSPHTALQELWEQTMRQGGGWVIDLDIRKYFAVKRACALGARERDRGLAALGHEQVRFRIGSAVRAAPFHGPSRRRVIRNRSFQPRAAACASARKPCRVSMRSQRGALRSTTSFS